MRIAMVVLMTSCLASCSGGPIKQRPAFEAPAEDPEPPAVEAPSPAPPSPAPIPPPPAPRDIERSELAAWWTSTKAAGPGSVSVRRIDIIFHEDGRFEGAAVLHVGSESALRTIRGTFELNGASLSMAFEDGRARAFDARYQEPELVLRQSESELRLERRR